jgi:hypothetical protein
MVSSYQYQGGFVVVLFLFFKHHPLKEQVGAFWSRVKEVGMLETD